MTQLLRLFTIIYQILRSINLLINNGRELNQPIYTVVNFELELQLDMHVNRLHPYKAFATD